MAEAGFDGPVAAEVGGDLLGFLGGFDDQQWHGAASGGTADEAMNYVSNRIGFGVDPYLLREVLDRLPRGAEGPPPQREGDLRSP